MIMEPQLWEDWDPPSGLSPLATLQKMRQTAAQRRSDGGPDPKHAGSVIGLLGWRQTETKISRPWIRRKADSILAHMNTCFHSRRRIQQGERRLEESLHPWRYGRNIVCQIQNRKCYVIPVIWSILELSNAEGQNEGEGLLGTVRRRK